MKNTLATSLVKPDLEYLLSAASRDVTRTNIRQVFFDAKNNRAVTTDGHRLHIVSAPLFPTQSIDVRAAEFLIESMKSLEAGALDVDGNVFALSGPAGSMNLAANVPDGRFPDIGHVIPVWVETRDMPAAEIKKLLATESHSLSNWNLDPAYVADALKGAPRKGTVKVHFPADDMSPIGFSFEVDGRERFAIVMPRRKQ